MLDLWNQQAPAWPAATASGPHPYVVTESRATDSSGDEREAHPRLIGRDAELASLDAFVASLARGPASITVEGEAGIGKTSLLDEAVVSARDQGSRVLRCSPTAAEARSPFSGLGDLLDGVSDSVISQLPVPQAHALDVALLRVDPAGVPAEPRTVGMALLSVLRALSRAVPLLLVIDDSQWLDAPSAAAVRFAVRRLQSEHVGLLAAVRLGGVLVPEARLDPRLWPDSGRLRLGPLSLGAIDRLLGARSGGPLPRRVMHAVHDASAGNPFFALEVARNLPDEATKRNGAPSLPLAHDLRSLLRARVAALPRETREALLVAAALSHPTVALIEGALYQPRVPSSLERAVDAGVITIDQGRIRFTHPLLASVAYWTAEPRERRRVHRLIAAEASDSVEGARHLALATSVPDEAVAARLSQAARVARERGAAETAADLARSAVRLTPHGNAVARSQRLVDAAEYALWNGATAEARTLLDTVIDVAPPAPIAVRALLLMGQVRFYTDGRVEAIPFLRRALIAAGDDRLLQGACHAQLGNFAPDWADAEAHSSLALDLLGPDDGAVDPEASGVALLTLFQANLARGRGLHMEYAQRASRLEPRIVGLRVIRRVDAQLGQYLQFVDDLDAARASLARAEQQARDEGDQTSLTSILSFRAALECSAGQGRLAAALADESVAIAAEVEHGLANVLGRRALINAVLGRVDEARDDATRTIELAEHDDPYNLCLGLKAMGFLELSLDNPGDAERLLSRVHVIAVELGFTEPAMWRVHGDLIEALVLLGRLDMAQKLLDELRSGDRAADVPWTLTTAARSEGLVLAARGDLSGAIVPLDAALAVLDRAPFPLELGRTLLVKGQLERRLRRKRAARESLERALAVFDMLPAPLWSAKASAGLRRTGLRPAAPFELTETEHQVAELTARGRTNRQVADALFLSPKTVEANLARIYRKLDIASRAELGAAMAARAPTSRSSDQT